MSFRNYRLQITCLSKYLLSHVSVHPRTVNILKGLKPTAAPMMFSTV